MSNAQPTQNQNQEQAQNQASSEQQLEQQRFDQRVRQLHNALFPEEYDFMLDSPADAKRRRRGHNPMSAQYIATVAKRRAQLGVPPLLENGLAADNASQRYCIAKLRGYDLGEPQ
ncbi:hypothetical protein [uncultured Ferrimonas sp.]|uniref:hypothetical protein n=1 Tax=uncultured Ferrimonas sp. TaxID=432640 RepID=UPI002615C385|nr:hypothetical protein [uncultured Ferrimonas sp.]